MGRKFDVVVFGATGFTGQLVAEYLTTSSKASFAIAGRSLSKLQQVADSLLEIDTKGQRFNGRRENVGMIEADSSNEAQLDEMCKNAQVIITTVGPYLKYGFPLVEACIRNGTDYVDLCGEPPFIRACIDNYHDRAVKAGVRICHATGFDSIPSDIGTYLLAAHFKSKGLTTDNVRLSVKSMSGSASGGTLASGANIIDALSFKELVRMQSNPDYLAPSSIPNGKIWKQTGMYYDKGHRSWQTPFIMEMTNLRLVRRSNALLDYGPTFQYGEAMASGNVVFAFFITVAIAIGGFLFLFSPVRWLASKALPAGTSADLTRPLGTGPSKEAREKGYFKVDLYGEAKTIEGKVIAAKVAVRAKGDPGYGATSRMMAESALCLALDRKKIAEYQGPFKLVKAGIVTPASCMGPILVERLRNNAQVSFDLQPVEQQ
ncbi:hypothetical protein HDV03_001248 [Kappamyces sp. JEL0829]|nr:hypothetical protein HDV03_001248 [Kappamyces sp. JEL0829]